MHPRLEQWSELRSVGKSMRHLSAEYRAAQKFSKSTDITAQKGGQKRSNTSRSVPDASRQPKPGVNPESLRRALEADREAEAAKRNSSWRFHQPQGHLASLTVRTRINPSLNKPSNPQNSNEHHAGNGQLRASPTRIRHFGQGHSEKQQSRNHSYHNRHSGTHPRSGSRSQWARSRTKSPRGRQSGDHQFQQEHLSANNQSDAPNYQSKTEQHQNNELARNNASKDDYSTNHQVLVRSQGLDSHQPGNHNSRNHQPGGDWPRNHSLGIRPLRDRTEAQSPRSRRLDVQVPKERTEHGVKVQKPPDNSELLKQRKTASHNLRSRVYIKIEDESEDEPRELIARSQLGQQPRLRMSASTRAVEAPPRFEHRPFPTPTTSGDSSQGSKEIEPLPQSIEMFSESTGHEREMHISEEANKLIQATADEVTKRIMSAHQKELAQLTAEVKELLGQLRMQSRTIQKQRDDWGAAGSPSVVQSIERDQTQQPGRATAEWDYIFAPIRGHSDDARDHTYVPSTDLGEEEDDGAKADTDDEPRKASTEGYEHNYEKHNEEDGVVLPTVECQSASESEDAAPSAPTPQRKRKWKQEHSMRSTTTTPSPRKKKSRHVEQGKVKRAHEKGKEMKSARVPVVVLSDNEEHDETEDRQQAALAAKKKQDKKVTPVVNPYLEIIAQEQARLRALRMA